MGWRSRIGHVIFTTDSRAARAFDVVLLWAIAASVVAVLLESVPSVRAAYGPALRTIEWAFTAAFTVEYVLRLLTARRPRRYAFSFFGLVDLVAILPAYLALLLGTSPLLVVLRALRLLRVFRVLKLTRYLGEASILGRALLASRAKITVFLTFVLTVVLIVGAVMYMVEGPEHGFDSIPIAMYWTIVTLTTVGYGDISPVTPLGRFLASLVMILGYGVIAVPTGIVTTELVRAERQGPPSLGPAAPDGARSDSCGACGATDHAPDARFCRRCGASLDAEG
jgi:voltage-gated potassium channel